jgi:hypothetical protein
MPIAATILPSTIGQGVLIPGQPGAIGGPGGPNSPYAGSGWEVTVLAAPSYYIQLAKLPPKLVTTVQFVKQLKDKGSGSITMTLDDPFWNVNLPGNLAAHNLLDYEHLWQVWQDGILRFEFFGETITETLIDPSEGRTVTVTGPGTITALTWAMAAPPGFPSIIYKLDAITDGFAEVNTSGQLVVDYGLWNQSAPQNHLSLSPSGTMKVMASPSTTFLGTNVFDATETLISAQVQPIISPDPAGNTLNNSQVTQFYIQDINNANNYFMIGMSSSSLYARLGDPSGVQTCVISSIANYLAAQQNNQPYSYWQISEHAGYFYAWTSGDGQSWTQQWKVRHTWAGTLVGFYFTAAYSVDNAEYALLSSLNSDVTTSSLAGAIYQNQPIMEVWLAELQAAQLRGTIPFVTTRMTASYDSFGNAWTDTQSVQIQNGTDLYSLLQGHCSMINADFVMQPGFLLTVGIPESGNITLGTDRSHQIVFREARGETSKTRTRTRNQIANLIAAINQDGRTVTASNPTSESNWGQREGWIQAAVQVNPSDLDIAAAASVQTTSLEQLTWTLQIIPNMSGQTVFRDFDVGDWIGLERPDYSAIDVVRVIAIAVQYDANGVETHELTLVGYLQWLQEQLTYVTQKLGGNLLSVNGTTPVSGGISSLVQPSVFAPTLAGLSDVLSSTTPAGAPLVWDPVTGKWVPAGTVNPDTGSTAPVQVSSPAGTTTVGPGTHTVTTQVGTAPTVGDSSGSATPVAAAVTTPTGVSIYDPNGTPRVVVGEQPDGSYTHATVNAPPPSPPDTPTVSGGALGVLVGWDGLLAGAAPRADFQLVQVHGSTINNFTPGTATLQGTMVLGGLFGIGGLGAGTPYYVKLVAVSWSGSVSVPSAQGTATPTTIAASLSPGSVPGTAIATGSITTTQIAANAGILGAQIANATITGANLVANTITAGQIAANTITAAQLAANIIYATIVDGTTITGASLVATGSTGEVLVYTGPPALGNLVLSISGASGHDTPGNAYDVCLGIYNGPANLNLLVDPTQNVPALNMLTGGVSEKGFGSVYTLLVNAGLVNEYEVTWLQGPASTYDSASVGIALTNSAKNGAALYAGQLVGNSGTGGGSVVAYWDANGLHINNKLYGIGGTLTVNDNFQMANGKGILGRDASWVSVGMASGWTNRGGNYPPFQVMRVAVAPGICWIRGNIQTSNTIANGATVASFGASYIPLLVQSIPIWQAGGTAVFNNTAHIEVTVGGAVNLWGITTNGTVQIGFSGIIFLDAL